MYHNLQITKVMDREEDKVDKGESGPLETNNQETLPAMPRIRIRSDLFKENRNANVVQNMMLMHQLESPTKTDSEGEDEVEKEEQEREEVVLGESSSGHSEASCKESTPQIWLPTADIDQDQEGVQQKMSTKGPVKGKVNLPGKKKEMLTGENKKADGSDEGNDLLAAAGLPVWQSQNHPGTNLSSKQVNRVPSPVCPEVEEGGVLRRHQDNSPASSDFDSVLKVGSARTHSRLPPCAPTSSSSRFLGAIDVPKAVGKGPRLVPISYKNPLDLTVIHFAPVCVATSKEEAFVKALVAEKNAEFDRRHGRLDLVEKGPFVMFFCLFKCILMHFRSDLPVKYTTAAVVARTILNTEVVKHITQCFTKKEMKTKVRKGSYLKRRIGPDAGESEKEKSDEECQVSGRLLL